MKQVPIKRLLATLVMTAFASQAGAMSLLQAYEAALKNDPTFQSAIHESDAGQENKNLGLSNLLPNLSLSYSNSKNRTDLEVGKTDSNPVYTSRATYLQLKQPLFNLDGYARYKQGVAQSFYSEAVFSARKQEMVIRVVSAYIDAQYAEEQLALSLAQRDALLEQQHANERMFDLGESTKTDVLETQSKFDSAQAQVIEGQDAVTNARNALSALVGAEVTSLDPLSEEFHPKPLLPAAFDDWKEIALSKNSDIESQRFAVESNQQEINKARAGHAPRLDFVGTLSKTDSESINTLNQNIKNRSIGIQLNVPLYSGGYVNAASRQAVANYEKSKTDLEAKTNQVLVELRKQYNLVLSGATRIDALQKAVKSSRLLVDATRQSIKGGVRINLDLLNAQQQMFGARRDLAQGRYNYLLAFLRLHNAAGTLGGEELKMAATYFAAAR